jgi:hypothetical protein
LDFLNLEEKMRRNLVKIAITLLCSLSAAFAGSDLRLSVNVPFAFNVGDREFSAGQYIVEVTNSGSAFALRDRDGEVLVRTMVRPEYADRRFTGTKLLFNRYQDQHFLAGLQSDGSALALTRSRLEKQVAAVHKGTTVTSLAE